MPDARIWVVITVEVATVFGCLAVFLIQLRGLSTHVYGMPGLRDDLRGLRQDVRLLEIALDEFAAGK